MGPDGAALCLEVGCNDMGGVLMDESITRAAGAVHGQQLGAADMDRLIRAAGRIPRQRTTLYGPTTHPGSRIGEVRQGVPVTLTQSAGMTATREG
jgi:2-iminoacetate synthase ThiH